MTLKGWFQILFFRGGPAGDQTPRRLYGAGIFPRTNFAGPGDASDREAGLRLTEWMKNGDALDRIFRRHAAVQRRLHAALYLLQRTQLAAVKPAKVCRCNARPGV